VVGSFGVTQTKIEPNAVVTDLYFTPDHYPIKLLGVCDVQSDSAACWDTTRKLNDSISGQVTEILMGEWGAKGHFGAVIPYLFQQKNRLVVFEYPAQAEKTYMTRFYPHLTSPKNDIDYGVHQFGFAKGATKFKCLPITASPDTSTASVLVDVIYDRTRSFDMPFRIGGTATSDGVSISIESVDEIKEHVETYKTKSTKNRGTRQRLVPIGWNILFKISDDSIRLKRTLEVEPLDSKGQPILWVNKTGRPGKPVPAALKLYNERGLYAESQGFKPVGYSRFDEARQLRKWELPVDPSFVFGLRIKFMEEKTVEFHDVPLDPK